jgi:putative ABC transport system permease protein
VILSFGLLQTILTAWYAGVAASSQNRLITRSAVSLVIPLPLSYRETLSQIEGVTRVSYGHWFGGIYIDEKNFFAQFAIDAKSWFDLYPEFSLPKDQMDTFLRERNACVAGKKLADRYGWKLGDTIRIRGTFYPGDWDFVLRGIYTGTEKSTDETQFFFHWDYLDQRLLQLEPSRAGHVGWYVLRIASPEQAGEISEAVDRRFKNSLAETLTETERSFQMGFVAMTEAILVALKAVSIIIIGVILVVLSNTMAMTARERISEHAVLKTLGFGFKHLSLLIGGESLLIASTGGLLGLTLLLPVSKVFGNALGTFFPVFVVEPLTLLLCGSTALLVGLISAAFPIWRATNLQIANGLRRIG